VTFPETVLLLARRAAAKVPTDNLSTSVSATKPTTLIGSSFTILAHSDPGCNDFE
jgi:hypothetical protein